MIYDEIKMYNKTSYFTTIFAASRYQQYRTIDNSTASDRPFCVDYLYINLSKKSFLGFTRYFVADSNIPIMISYQWQCNQTINIHHGNICLSETNIVRWHVYIEIVRLVYKKCQHLLPSIFLQDSFTTQLCFYIFENLILKSS